MAISTMRFIVTAAAVVAMTPVVLAQGPKINTLMSATECQPVQITWQGGTPPYYLSLIPGGQPGAQALKQFPQQNGNDMTWTVDLPAGTSFTSSLRDSTGTQAFSDIQTVQSGLDNSCLNGGSSQTTSMSSTSTTGTSSETFAASTETATTASVPAGVQKVVSTTTSGSASATISGTVAHAASGVSSGTAATATSSNAASLHTSAGAIGIAGLLGLVGAALLG